MQYKCKKCNKLNNKNAISSENEECVYCNKIQQTPESPWSPGAILGFRYAVIQAIGRGGHGYVCLCRDLLEDHTCVLKIFHHELLTKEIIDSFYNEAQLARDFGHPNIVRTYGGSIDGDTLYIVQDWICGLDLVHYEKKVCRLTINQLMYILKTCCQALQYMWENHQLIHRDIKPENILLSHRGEVFLTDFGIMTTAKELHKEGLFFCTPEYVDPESALGKGRIDFRSDIYSLGASFYRLISGYAPFKSKNTQELIMKRTIMPVPDLRAVCDVTEDVAGLIYKMMQVSIEDRYQSYDELINAIAYTTMTQNQDLHTHELEEPPNGR
jgi:eukaryotic-like serine/threonine-protein kinase